MNNTISQSRINNSRPSFKGFSQKAQRYITEESVGKLVEAGKIKLSDFAYLKAHKLEIDVLKADPKGVVRGEGLHIKSPYLEAERVASEANYYNSPIDIKLTPTKDKFIFQTFEDVGETLGAALKKAVKFFKKFDKIENKKDVYFSENGAKIAELKAHKEKAQNAYRAALHAICADDAIKLDDQFQEIGPIDKKLSRFHDDEYFEKKQGNLFSVWNIHNIIGN